MKRVMAINDLAGFGRVALSTTIPIISAMGSQVCPLPTVLLSSHAGYKGFSHLDLTSSMRDMLKHWGTLKIAFDVITTGFMLSKDQMEVAKEAFTSFKKQDQHIIIDPVMADDGKLYSTFGQDYVAAMQDFISYGDIITPNITEALLLLGMDDIEKVQHISIDEIKILAIKLSDMGPKIVIITSVPVEDSPEKKAVLAYDRQKQEYIYISEKTFPGSYPGTGDIFTSVLIGSILQGNNLKEAIGRAVDFVFFAISHTYNSSEDHLEGIQIEKVLDSLFKPSRPVFEVSNKIAAPEI